MPPKTAKPKLENPYPLHYAGEEIEDFKYESPMILRREIEAVKMRGGKDDAEYIVGADYVVSYRLEGQVNRRTIKVPKGMLTDLSSSPRAAWALVAPVGPHLEASIVHDFLYIAWQDLDMEARSNDWEFADNIMRAGMVEAGVDRSQIAMIYAALRGFGWPVYKKPDPLPRYVVVP
jgi:hypothetical protein